MKERAPGSGRRRVILRIFRFLLPAAPLFLLTACVFDFDKKPLANIDRPPPRLGAAGDLDAAALHRIAERAEAGGMDATQVYRRLAEKEPSSPAPRVALARHLLQRGDVGGAEAEYRQAISIAPRDPDARLGLAQLLYSRGRLREASTEYRAVIESDSGNVRALTGLGAILDNEGQHEAAQAQYRRALEIDQRDKSARNNMGLSLALGGKFDEAIPLLQTLAAEPDATAAHRATLTRATKLRDRAAKRRN